MVWDYAESSPLNEQGANWQACVDAAAGTIKRIEIPKPAIVSRGSATSLAVTGGAIHAVITDPPYYDAVPYSDLSDFFYVWLKRTAGKIHPDPFTPPLSPKQQEIVEQRRHTSLKTRKDAAFYEKMMARVFTEIHRSLADNGTVVVMFAHKTTSAWETLISGLIRSGLAVTASWPLRTEKPGRATSLGTAALASSVSLVCRKRAENAGSGFWDDVRKELQQVARERLEFFWSQGIRGADFFISAIGPALSVFGKYESVTKLSGEGVTVGQFLDEVRALVTNYALAKILKTTHTASIDPESRFYVVWKWSYGDARVPADESFKLAQALGTATETMWDRTGVLEKSKEHVQALPVAKRMKIKDLGEPNADSSPASMIDVLHRMCAFREKGDAVGMAEFVARSGQAKNPTLWLVAQAISEILPDGEKEKQLNAGPFEPAGDARTGAGTAVLNVPTASGTRRPPATREARTTMDDSTNQPSHSTPSQIRTQLEAQAAAILAEGVVLSSFKHRGLSGIEREEPVRRFLRTHLPGRFHVGQGSIASAQTILPHQHDIIVADRDLCFMLLNTLSSQLMAIESVHLIVEVRSRLGELDDLAKSLSAVRSLNARQGLRQLGASGSETGSTPPPVQAVIIYQGPKKEETAIEHLNRVNGADSVSGRRLPVDFILVLAKEGDQTPASGYLIGYSRKEDDTGLEFRHHIYPHVNEEGIDGPKVIWSGGDSFARWYAALLNHLSGVVVYPPNLYSHLGDQIAFVPWTKWPY